MFDIPNLSFATIVEADHDYLLALASKIRDPSCRHERFLKLLIDFTWRLVRHDICEELVMRPAFVRFLGAEGIVWASNDRDDHDDIRRQLLSIWTSIEHQARGKPDALLPPRALALMKPLLSRMALHMKEESGIRIPRFSEAVGPQEAVRIGRDYALALTLTPDLDEFASNGNGSLWSALLPSHVAIYVQSEVGKFRSILMKRSKDPGQDVYVGRMIEELEKLGLGEYVEQRKEKYYTPRIKL